MLRRACIPTVIAQHGFSFDARTCASVTTDAPMKTASSRDIPRFPILECMSLSPLVESERPNPVSLVRLGLQILNREKKGVSDALICHHQSFSRPGSYARQPIYTPDKFFYKGATCSSNPELLLLYNISIPGHLSCGAGDLMDCSPDQQDMTAQHCQQIWGNKKRYF